jgi:hypothetical protein
LRIETVGPALLAAYAHPFNCPGGISMYPAIPVEVFSGAVNLVWYFFTIIAVLVTLSVSARG